MRTRNYALGTTGFFSFAFFSLFACFFSFMVLAGFFFSSFLLPFFLPFCPLLMAFSFAIMGSHSIGCSRVSGGGCGSVGDCITGSIRENINVVVPRKRDWRAPKENLGGGKYPSKGGVLAALQQIQRVGLGNSLSTALYSQLAVDVLEVCFDRTHGNDQLLCDGRVGKTGSEQMQNLEFPVG